MRHQPVVICPKAAKCIMEKFVDYEYPMELADFCPHSVPHTRIVAKSAACTIPKSHIKPYCPSCTFINSEEGKKAAIESAKASILGIHVYAELRRKKRRK